MKKFIKTILCLCAFFTLPVLCAHAEFSDVPENHWAYESIQKASEQNIMSGYGDGIFGLGENVKRGEFCAMLNRLMGFEVSAPSVPSFSDVSGDAWYYADVETALAHDVTDLEGGLFRPEDYITREEMAVMLVRALGYKTLAQSVDSCPFSDVSSNAGYIDAAYSFGIINGRDDTTFDPQGLALREEGAAMMVRLLDRYSQKLSWLHGFYAISSWSQRELGAQMNNVSFGWSRMEYSPDTGIYLNTTSSNNNDWRFPDGYEDALSYYRDSDVGMNLAVMMNTSQSVQTTDGTSTDLCSYVLLNAENRTAAAEEIASALGDFDGVTIDFEGMRGEELKSSFNLFLAELKQLIGDKQLYVMVHPVMKSSTYYDAYDYKTIGSIADKVILMAHDYGASFMEEDLRNAGFTTTPVTPFDEVYHALKAITDADTGISDKNKIALAVSTSSTVCWLMQDGKVINETPVHPAMDTILRRLTQVGTVINYSDTYRNPYAEYTDDDGNTAVLWYEDSRSIGDKIDLAKMFGINGLSVWRIGAVPTSDTPGIYYNVWDSIMQRTN